jgi:multidrug efflux system membrane fusion protein
MEPKTQAAGRPSTARSHALFFDQWSCIRLSTVKRLSLTIGSVVLAVSAGCRKPAPPQQSFPPEVTVAIAEAKEEPVFLDEIGKAIASQSVSIQPQVTGKILKRDFKDGDDIKEGETLFEIDPRPYLATRDQANGQKDKDAAMLANAKSVFDRDTKAMSDNPGALSKSQVDADKASMDEATAAIAADQAAIEAAQVNVDYCTIKSPINGRAGQRLVDAGNVVLGAGYGVGTSLLTVQTLDPIYVDFTIPESELPRVRDFMARGTLEVLASLPQDTVQAIGIDHPTTQATAAPGTLKPIEPANAPMASTEMPATRPMAAMGAPTTGPTTMPMMTSVFAPREGKLTFLDNAIQDGTGTIKLRATLENQDRHFWPGQFVQVRLVLETKKGAIMIPRQATQVSQTGPFVYTVDANSVAALTPIGLGQRDGELVMINSGLKPGDKVVVTGQMLIQPGKPVMVVPSGAPAGAHAGAGGH